MTYIGEPVKPGKVVRRPKIVSVPVRPSEKAKRRRELWQGPEVGPEIAPAVAPARQPAQVPARREKEPV